MASHLHGAAQRDARGLHARAVMSTHRHTHVEGGNAAGSSHRHTQKAVCENGGAKFAARMPASATVALASSLLCMLITTPCCIPLFHKCVNVWVFRHVWMFQDVVGSVGVGVYMWVKMCAFLSDHGQWSYALALPHHTTQPQLRTAFGRLAPAYGLHTRAGHRERHTPPDLPPPQHPGQDAQPQASIRAKAGVRA